MVSLVGTIFYHTDFESSSQIDREININLTEHRGSLFWFHQTDMNGSETQLKFS